MAFRSCGAVWILLALAACSDPDRRLPPSYQRLEVPEELLASAAARARGRELFLRNCALCHGEQADGRGVRRDALSTRPQDFTSSAWRARATPRSVYHVIREGKRGTPMASWKTLGPEETWDLVAYLLSVHEEAS